MEKYPYTKKSSLAKLMKSCLESSWQGWDNPGELADADDVLVGDVGDGGRAVERQEVVLTDGENVDVFDGDDLAIAKAGHFMVRLAWNF